MSMALAGSPCPAVADVNPIRITDTTESDDAAKDTHHGRCRLGDSGARGADSVLPVDPTELTVAFDFYVSPLEKKEDTPYWVMTRKEKMKIMVDTKIKNHAVGLRLVTCHSHKKLTAWQQIKKLNHYYTLTPALKKGTCFQIQSGRSQAYWVYGAIRGHFKRK